MKAVKRVEWGIHLGIVSLSLFLFNYPAFDLTFGIFNSGDGSLLWPSVTGTVFNLVLFYVIAFYLIPVTLKKGVGRFVVMLALLFVIVSALESVIDFAFYRASGLPIDDTILSELVVMVLISHVLVIIISFAYRFSRDWFANERLRRSIYEHQLRSELEVLKSQINPHFLFNALNNLFSMALQSGDEKTAEGINKLAEMMRYVFDKTGSDQVPLVEEFSYISDYIFLQQLRFKKQVDVNFNYPEKVKHFNIAPMLLIPFVENAFKYGVSSHTKSIINITATTGEDSFVFEVDNEKVEKNESIPSSGVGLENVRKRLELLYPGKHELNIHEDANQYKVRLVMLKKI